MFEKFKKQKGFSLVELMVVVAIMGILSGIAIPQYLSYRREAVIRAMDAELKNVIRAFTTCVSVHGFEGCDEMRETNLVGYTAGPGNTVFHVPEAPRLCMDIVRKSSGVTYKGCVSIDAVWGGASYGLNIEQCFNDGGTRTGSDTNDCDMDGNSSELLSAVCTTGLDLNCLNECGDSYTVTPKFCSADFRGGQDGDAYCKAQGFDSTNGMCGTKFMGECIETGTKKAQCS